MHDYVHDAKDREACTEDHMSAQGSIRGGDEQVAAEYIERLQEPVTGQEGSGDGQGDEHEHDRPVHGNDLGAVPDDLLVGILLLLHLFSLLNGRNLFRDSNPNYILSFPVCAIRGARPRGS